MTDTEDITVDVKAEYDFTISESIKPEYGIVTPIIEWLQENLQSLTDDDEDDLFGKVNVGFNESSLKSFGKKPVVDVYVDNLDYGEDFDDNIPTNAHTFIICALKGANNPTYLKACELHDLLMQEFITNDSFRHLPGKVRDTIITNSEIRIQPLNKKYGIVVALELNHKLYQ